MTLPQIFIAASATVLLYGLWKATLILSRPFFSTLRNLPGPKSASFVFGNMEQIRKADNAVMHEKWIQEYGHTIKYKGFFNSDRLFTMDTRALNHILTHSNDYQKPAQARFNLSRILGDGILVTEGDQHRQQRRIMNPSFSPAQIRDLTSIFLAKAIQLRDIWLVSASKEEPKRIEVLSWLSRATLDVIGLAGFDYRFDALNVNEKPNELSKAFSTLFHADAQFRILPFLQAFFPVLRHIPSKRGRQTGEAQATMRRIGQQMISERKRALLGEETEEDRLTHKDGYNMEGRDLLSALMKANMDTELPDTQRMNDADVLAQVPTFLVAGHETTSTETMWCLFALSDQPDLQTKLRAELRSVPTDTPSMDTLMGLPYLDAVVRETLRLHAAVPSTIRVAMKDDVIPLNTPFVDRYGNTQSQIRISKGDPVLIPILAINRSKEIWGADALDFNPDRWSKLPEAVHGIPGVWGGILSFLGGARSCIGYRFALVEMKALLFTLVRAFEFKLAVPASDIEKRSLVVQRPYLRSEKEKGAQMPLLVRPVQSK